MKKDANFIAVEGGCDCRRVRYKVVSKPLIIHCCHCTWCQRESGAAFALNAMIEADRVILNGSITPKTINTPSASGFGQVIVRCPECWIALWSNYGESGDRIRFVKVGTLDDPNALGSPDIHIFTSTKQKWINLTGSNIPVVEEYYDRNYVWSEESLERIKLVT